MLRIKSLKFKFILVSALCILVLGVFSNIFLYRYLSGIITEKADHIDSLVLQTVQGQLDLVLDELNSLSLLGAYDLYIARGMQNTKMDTVRETREVIAAQEALQLYLNSLARIEPYVNRLMVFNEHGVRAQAVSRDLNRMTDVRDVMDSEIFKRFVNGGEKQLVDIAPAIFSKKDSLVCISGVYELPSSTQYGWIYIEVNPAFATDIFAPYTTGSLYVSYGDGYVYPPDFPGPVAGAQTAGNTLTENDRVYKFQSIPLRLSGASLFNRTDITFLSADANAIIFTAAVVAANSVAVAVFLFIVLSEMEKMYIRQKNSEIALLQSRVNPHFLYNTLDTVRWLAVIQKAPGIEKTVRSLSNLLKNMAKGMGDKITLEEELSLLKDYIDTQSVRFMELLEFSETVPPHLRGCLIVKFTLQPLVENAIFHGIEPTGEFGRITVDAEEDGDYIRIRVEDNGVGMSAEEIDGLSHTAERDAARPMALRPAARRSAGPAKMSGMGIKNVDDRLKLVYGKQCGLSYSSEPGKFTRVTVRIRKEQPNA